MKKTVNRLMAFALALCLALGGLGQNALAQEEFYPPTQDMPFTDIPNWSWFYPYLERALELGVFSGTSATTFGAQRALTRAEAVTALARVHEAITGEPVAATPQTPFADVPASSWCAEYVSWAHESGLASGTGDGRFLPGRPVTYAELVVMFHRYLQLIDRESLYDPVPAPGGSADWYWFPGWAMPHMNAISGYDIFSSVYVEEPMDHILRYEATRWYVRLYEKAVFPVDKETPRQKFLYDYHKPGEDNGWPVLENEDQYTILTSYLEYSQYMMDRQNGAEEFQKVKQAAPLEIDQALFEDYDLLAADLRWYGAGMLDYEFGGVDIEGGEAKLTAVEKAFTKNGSCGRAVLFLTPAPKGTVQASVTYLCWTEEVYPE